MNERIKLLAVQAGILKEQTVKAKIVKNEDGTWTSILEYPDLEKFAELIVRECANSLWTEECYTSDLALEEFERNSAKIKEHFGVEE
jgi:hypothetical protein